MWQMVVKRFLRGVLTVIIVIILIFFVMRVAPSDPASLLAGPEASEEQIAAIRASWGLDKPVIEQFRIYIGSLLTGDAGMSYQYSNNSAPVWSVLDLVMARFPNTVRLALAAMGFCIVVGIPSGIFTAVYRGSLFDNLVMGSGFTILSFPTFFVGMVLLNLFAIHLKILPTGGNDSFACIILPAITMGSRFLITLIRTTRTEIIQIMKSDYIKTVRAKGLSSTAVLFVHCLRNASIPLVTLIGQRFGTMMGGAVVTESLFRWPGIGNLLITSVQARDYPTVQFLVPYVAIVFILINVIVDILYGVLDPRIRKES